MEKVIQESIPTVQAPPALPVEVAPSNNNLRDAGIVIVVLVAAAVAAKLYQVTSKKK